MDVTRLDASVRRRRAGSRGGPKVGRRYARAMLSPQFDPTPTSFSRVTLARIMDDGDANLHGNVHGGVIMKAVDDAAGASAARHSRGKAVTVSMDEMVFLEPVRIGDIITVKAQVNWTGSSSMEVGARVTAQRWDDADAVGHHVASAYLVFVAIGADERPRTVIPVVPETDVDQHRWAEAIIRRESRLSRRAAIQERRVREAEADG
jgi:acyl-CoA hydrolase